MVQRCLQKKLQVLIQNHVGGASLYVGEKHYQHHELISYIQESTDATTSVHPPPPSMCVRKFACPTHL